MTRRSKQTDALMIMIKNWCVAVLVIKFFMICNLDSGLSKISDQFYDDYNEYDFTNNGWNYDDDGWN